MNDSLPSSKAQPDTGTLDAGDFVFKALEKVQLDLEDAAFLDIFEEEEALPVVSESSLAPPKAPPKPKKIWQNKVFILGFFALILFVVVAFIYFLYFMKVPPPEAVVEPVIVVVPSAESISGKKEFHIPFAPFLIEQRDEDTVRFLQTRFRAVTQNNEVATEAKQKLLSLRDAIYYYLRNKTHQFLIEPGNAAAIKQDLLDVTNSYISKGKFEAILYEDYILR